MERCYINGIGSVGIQALTFNLFNDSPVAINTYNQASHPSYKEIIPAGMLRRMASGVKMGIFAANQAIQEAKIDNLDAIITGTGLGCLQDSEKFLASMLANEEEYLTPTSFIQSTHNTVAAQIALHFQCRAYNFTYVNGANSFESALFDGLQQIEVLEASNVLIGGVEETSSSFDALFQLAGNYKADMTSIDFKQPNSAGACRSEGANFFVLSAKQLPSSYAQLVDVHYFNKPRISAQVEIEEFLNRNQLTSSDIDIVFLGYNADVTQQHYFDIYANLFPRTTLAYYQHISGSFDTASAYGLKVAVEILKNQIVPSYLMYNNIKPIQLKTILLINQSQGLDHSFVLIKSC
ncbi:3-oxoacyl-ACP synthase [Sphingobacterium sp. DK4209]|uniref:3-oxoacyl-ACP synthase n=1 Tax=Sphingobacterium zhuxiongii TaxID=2662364 RepID=A0A5Q0Q8S3_9SPHI|nr:MULTISPECIES: beta-ketoacyl synthase N-terminal-like domain-containing protein [unclassified Sphingobacterium]MVZ64586.1 3-oxoacyl-ACP synthase [Sphingobacterium sp. DK4209]QGA25913.1 3-oxoacyl-ACP synthase [Sphingobacterium sp. dk4302]